MIAEELERLRIERWKLCDWARWRHRTELVDIKEQLHISKQFIIMTFLIKILQGYKP